MLSWWVGDGGKWVGYYALTVGRCDVEWLMGVGGVCKGPFLAIYLVWTLI